MPPVFFVSYARTDIELPKFRKAFEYFVKDLKARVGNRLPQEPLVAFVDADILTGEVWTQELSNAIAQCKVGVALYSPRYFTRRWCGKEFQVLLRRGLSGPGGSGIIPVRWEKPVDPPECAARLQHTESQYPKAYAALGMRQLVIMRSARLTAYEQTIELLVDRIVAAANTKRLGPLPPGFDLESVPSAWEEAIATDPNSHKEGNVSKTCFVFLSKSGWDWIPYQDRAEKIGALAQKIAGELGVRYEEIPCDDSLPRKLADTNKEDVPTVLVGDPQSLEVERFARSLDEYDARFLPNCAALVAWEPETKDGIDADARWVRLKKLSKVKSPPPFHEWRTIFSHDDLDRKTRALIEQIRSQLLKQLVSDPERAVSVAKAENTALAQSAAAQGIDTQTLSHLEAPGR
jgi:hypothetical protein